MEPIDKLSFEDALSQLEKLVNDLDKGNVPLEKSVELYQRGAELKSHCESQLKDAELKIQEITKDGSSKPMKDLQI